MYKSILTTSLILLYNILIAQHTNYTETKNGIKLTGLETVNEFLKAKLSLTTQLPETPTDTGKMTFSFKVTDYSLGAQSPDADLKMCANSAKGQHIHFILDNQPYIASYTADITSSLKPGHHVLLAFLSRSYHESIKTETAYVLKEFNTGKKSVDQFNDRHPHIFYSRPKGEYLGKKETSKILLDFYLINCKLSESEYKVRATIDTTEFILPIWEPYFIEGLSLGEHKIKLELIDKAGKLVISPFNATERTIKLSEEPASK
jgi:hypothetical protein